MSNARKVLDSQSSMTTLQMQPSASVWRLNLVGYSRIAQQYYCELHRKRPQALLGSSEFVLPYELIDDYLYVKKEDFKKLEALVKERIINDPTYIDGLISSRQKRLETLRTRLNDENKLLKCGKINECQPVEVFSNLTDMACYYLEYNFPSALFKELLVEKLGYSPEIYENLRLRLLTAHESAYLTYYKAILELAQQKLNGHKIDLCSFKQQSSCIGNRELGFRSDRELEAAVYRIMDMLGNRLSIYCEIRRVSAVEQKIIEEHASIRKELLLKCQHQDLGTCSLVLSLSSMLIDAALENEQTSIWRGRVFAYLNLLIDSLGLNPKVVSVEDIQAEIDRRK